MIQEVSFWSFFESLQYQYLQRAIVSTVIVGIVCGLIGVFIILKGLSFLGAGIAHSCFAGAALAILLGTDPFFSILIFGEVAAFIIGFINEKDTSGKNDTAVGVMFSFTMALAILFVGLIQGYSTNVQSILFGNALTITELNMIRLIIVSIIIVALFLLLKKELLFITFDQDMARVSGIPVRFLNYLFLAMIAGVITVSLKGIGAILVFAMIVTPAAAAYQWTYKTNTMLILASIFGACSSFFGIMISFIFDLPTGSSIVLIVTSIFAMSFILSPKRRMHKYIKSEDQVEHIEHCQYCKEMYKDRECPFCEEEKEEHIHEHGEDEHSHEGHQHH